MRWLTCTALVLIAVLGCATVAAQTGPGYKEEMAKKYIELAERHYQTSNYPEALTEFEKAYRLDPKPELLFNIARCHEVMARLEQAIESYERYLKEAPQSPDRDLVQVRIENLRKRLEKQREESRPPAPTPAAQGASPSPSRWKRTVGWVAAGVGGAALVTGVVLGVLASNKSDEYDQGVTERRTFQALEEIDQEGQDLEAGQIATLVVGGVLAAVGAGLLVWDMKSGKERGRGSGPAAYLAPVTTGRSAGLVVGARF